MALWNLSQVEKVTYYCSPYDNFTDVHCQQESSSDEKRTRFTNSVPDAYVCSVRLIASEK